jgi:hypothetical protein
MPCRNRVNLGLRDRADEFVREMQRTWNRSRNEIVNTALDYCIDRHVDLRLMQLEIEERQLSRDLERVRAEMQTLRGTSPQESAGEAEVFSARLPPLTVPQRAVPGDSARTAENDLRQVRGTEREHQTFKDLVPSLLNGTASPRAVKWWRKRAEAFPQWLSEIGPDERSRIDTMRGLSKSELGPPDVRVEPADDAKEAP